MEIIESELASQNKAHPEIVLCVRDDNDRAIRFCEKYSEHFYLAFLCDGDFSELLEYAGSKGKGRISILRRVIDNIIPEEYFVHYLKQYSPSGIGIFLCTDEVVDRKELQEVFKAEGGYVISITRKDYINGLYFKDFKRITRGGAAEKLLISNIGLHRNIEYVCNSPTFNIAVEHHSVADLPNEFTKILNYVLGELTYNIDGLRSFILRRYVLNLARDVVNLRILYRAGLKIYAWNLLMNTLVLVISLILIVENKMRN